MNGNETNGNSNGNGNGNTNQSDETFSTGGAATATGTRTEEFKLIGEDIMAKVREIIEEGNARRIILRNADGHNLIKSPWPSDW